MFTITDKFPLSFTKSLGQFVEIKSPNDGSTLTRIQMATIADIELLIQSAGDAQKKIEVLRPYERANILKSVANNFKQRQDYLAWIIASEGGKPLKDAKIEVSRAISTIELCAEECLRLHGEVVPMERTAAGKDHLSFTTKAPIGPVLAISAFNHPLNLIAHQVGCAIAAGCSVVLKPASSTPISAFLMSEAFNEAGLPTDVLRVLYAEVKLIENLVSSSVFDFVSFIGSAQVGWDLRRKIANGTRISLEHGGQAPAIVRADADLETAMTSLIKGSFYHAGQVCISTQKIFVHQNIFSDFVSHFSQRAEALKIGMATDEDTDVGPLIKPSEVQRIQKWIAEAVSSGAKLITGNKVSGTLNQFIAPTVLTHVPRDTKMMIEEVFGPVVCINPYQDEDELLAYINSNHYIFEAALFTQDINRAFSIAQNIKAMTFVINNHTAFRVDQMPFGGHKEAGLGMGGVKYAIEEMTRTKQIIIKM